MKKSHRFMMIVAPIILISILFIPIWKITLEAPQYPASIGMYIYLNKFKGAKPNDIKNINIMNHYVGMEPIPESIPEFKIFPYVIVGLIILGVCFGLIGKRKLYLVWFILLCSFATIAVYDFYNWEYEYGHNLEENAPLKFTDDEGNPLTYQPPLIGNKVILNFKASSWPSFGAYLMFISMVLSFYSYYGSGTGKKITDETDS